MTFQVDRVMRHNLCHNRYGQLGRVFKLMLARWRSKPYQFEIPSENILYSLKNELKKWLLFMVFKVNKKPLETFLDDLIKFFSGVGVSLDKSIVINSDSMLSSFRPKSQIKLDFQVI